MVAYSTGSEYHQTEISRLSLKLSRERAVNDIAEEIGRVVRQHLDECTKTCINCDHFDEKTEECYLAQARPPARVIAFGCEKYQDKIPF